MNILRGPYYSLNYKVLRLTGVWFHLSKTQKRIRTFFISFILFSFLIAMCLGLLKAIRLGDTATSLECFSPLVALNFTILLFFDLLVKGKQIAIILEKIQKDWEIWSIEPEIHILKEYAIKGKKFRLAFAASYTILTTCYIFVTITPQILDLVVPLNESRPRLPIYYIEFGVDNEKYFYSIFVHNFLTTYMNMVLFINTETMFIACTQHTSSIYAAIGSKLTNLMNSKRPFRLKGYNFDKCIEKDIVFCVKQHKKVLTFLDDIHSCFSVVYFIIVLLNIIMISVTGVAIVDNLNEPAVVFKFVAFNIGQMIHILWLTIPCEEMTDLSINILNSVYESEWYLLPVRYQKLLLMIMKRSSRPCEFICGNLYTFSMKNFAVVIKTAVSYFTVLMSVKR